MPTRFSNQPHAPVREMTTAKGHSVRGWRRPAAKGRWLYRPLNTEMEEILIKYILYYAFSDRSESDMQVWRLLR